MDSARSLSGLFLSKAPAASAVPVLMSAIFVSYSRLLFQDPSGIAGKLYDLRRRPGPTAKTAACNTSCLHGSILLPSALQGIPVYLAGGRLHAVCRGRRFCQGAARLAQPAMDRAGGHPGRLARVVDAGASKQRQTGGARRVQLLLDHCGDDLPGRQPAAHPALAACAAGRHPGRLPVRRAALQRLVAARSTVADCQLHPAFPVPGDRRGVALDPV